jgi:hypothetical protein
MCSFPAVGDSDARRRVQPCVRLGLGTPASAAWLFSAEAGFLFCPVGRCVSSRFEQPRLEWGERKQANHPLAA